MQKMRIGSRVSSRGWPVVRVVCPLLLALAVLAIPKRAHALINAGAEAGVIKRSADSPNNLKLGLGYGVHGELDLIPLLKLGPYYLHYELASADTGQPGASDAVFNTLGLRARFMLPIPGSYKPYAYVGAGYTWAAYSPLSGDKDGHFFETPIGVGVAYEVVEIFQLSVDAAYRPGTGFGGTAFDAGNITHPTSGWSIMLGAALNL
jgi:hypothetical protein